MAFNPTLPFAIHEKTLKNQTLNNIAVSFPYESPEPRISCQGAPNSELLPLRITALPWLQGFWGNHAGELRAADLGGLGSRV